MEAEVLEATLAICRLKPSDRVPSWALELHEGFTSITRTPDELSIVCPQDAVPPDTTVDEDWRALKAAGAAALLAEAGITARTIATYDAEYVLVRQRDLAHALKTLDAQAHPRRLISSGSPYEPTIGFSRAVKTRNRVLVSGTGPVLPDGGCPASTAEQARRCWEIVIAALAEAGASAADVVRTRTLLTPSADAAGAIAAHGEIFDAIRPASTIVVVHALLDPRWTVEVEAEAELHA